MRKWIPSRTTLFLITVTLLLAALAWSRGGARLVSEGLKAGALEFWRVAPLLLAAFLVAGMTQVLVSREVVERWLGSGSGWRGILLACLGGAIIPGGPYVYYPIAGALLHSGAGLGVMMAFVTAKNLWSITRLPYEFALLGPKLTLTRFALTLVIPPLIGFLTELFFGRRIAAIREAVQ